MEGLIYGSQILDFGIFSLTIFNSILLVFLCRHVYSNHLRTLSPCQDCNLFTLASVEGHMYLHSRSFWLRGRGHVTVHFLVSSLGKPCTRKAWASTSLCNSSTVGRCLAEDFRIDQVLVLPVCTFHGIMHSIYNRCHIESMVKSTIEENGILNEGYHSYNIRVQQHLLKKTVQTVKK